MILKNNISAVLAACVFLVTNANSVQNGLPIKGFVEEQGAIDEDTYNISINEHLQTAINEIIGTFIKAGFEPKMFVNMLSDYDFDEDMADSLRLSDVLSKFISTITYNLNDARLVGRIDFINEQLDIVKLHATVLDIFDDEEFADYISKFSSIANRIRDEETVQLRKALFKNGIIAEFNNVEVSDNVDHFYQFINNALLFISKLPIEQKAKFADCQEAFEFIKYSFEHITQQNTVGIDEQYLDGIGALFSEPEEENTRLEGKTAAKADTEIAYVDPDIKYGQYIAESFSTGLSENSLSSSKFQNRMLKAINPVLADNTKRLIKKLEDMQKRIDKELAWRDGETLEYQTHITNINALHNEFLKLTEEDKTGELNFVDTMRKIRSTIRNCEITDEMLDSANTALERNMEERIGTLGISAHDMLNLFFNSTKNVFGSTIGTRLDTPENRDKLSNYIANRATEGAISGKIVNNEFVVKALNELGISVDGSQQESLRKALLKGIDAINTPIGQVKQDIKKLGYKTKSIAGSIVKLFSKGKDDRPFRKRDIIINPKKFWAGIAAHIKEKRAAQAGTTEDQNAISEKAFRKRDIILNPKKFWTGILNRHKGKSEATSKTIEETSVTTAQLNAEEPQNMRKRDRIKAGAKKVGKAIAKPFVKLKKTITKGNN